MTTPAVPAPDVASLDAWMSRCARVPLGHWPTPLVRLPTLSARLGIDLWLKRDECSGLAAGGNKARKLEFVLAEVVQRGIRSVVTAGPMTSNHTMMTAAAGRRLGLDVHVVLGGQRPDPATGNLLLTEDFGATIHATPMDTADPSPDSVAAAVALADDLVRRHQAFFIPPGATMPESVPGYAGAVSEIVTQCHGTWPFDDVVVAQGTGSTAAGLWVGLALARIPARVLAVAVARQEALTRFATPHPRVLGQQAWQHFGLPARETWPDCEWILGYGEDGYARPSATADAALRTMAREEGHLLDPIYTARAFAALLDLTSRGLIARGRRVLFVHTGGLSMTPLAGLRHRTSP
jgi:L-cysteate sulfo-lyase